MQEVDDDISFFFFFSQVIYFCCGGTVGFVCLKRTLAESAETYIQRKIKVWRIDY